MSDSRVLHEEGFSGLIAAAHTPFHSTGRLDTSVIQRQYELFQESAVDGAFLLVAAIAAFVPARQAATLDPVEALRNE
jgi:ABC-type lipoprotein release transport system permease subunit